MFEKKPEKTNALVRQRPSWSVYECDCVAAIQEGAGSHLAVNFLDIDPYGECWPVLDAFLFSKRPFPSVLAIAVNCGLRQKLKMGGGWNVGSMSDVVARHGNDGLYKNYLEVAREMVQEKTGQLGYKLTRWGGYYCGHAQQMTHFAALLVSDVG